MPYVFMIFLPIINVNKSYLSLLPLAAMASCVLLSPIHEPSMKHQNELKEDLSFSNGGPHVDGSSFWSSDLAKQDGDFVELPLFKRGEYYTTELYMGSRGERIEVVIHMGYNDLRIFDGRPFCQSDMKSEVKSKREVPEHNNGTDDVNKSGREIPSFHHLSKRQEDDCKARGAFNKAKPSTFKLLQDRVGLDKVGTSKTMVRMIFEVDESLTLRRGYLGIGFADETILKRQIDGKYANFPEALRNAGYIKRRAYSLFLKGQDDNSGSILFGAVDHRKYVGKLQTVPMLKMFSWTNENPIYFVVVDKIYLENSSQKVVLSKQPISASLNLNDLWTQTLPLDIYLALVRSMSGESQPGLAFPKVDCGYRTSTGNIVYEFSGIKIKVPMKDLVGESKDTCYLKVRAYFSNHAYLTNCVLGNIYLTVDLEKREVSMAQAKLSREEEIEEIGASVPRAVKAERNLSSSVGSFSALKVAKFEIETDE